MFEVEPIGYVHGGRTTPVDDFWGETRCTIELANGVPSDSLDGIEEFSHIEVVFLFDRVEPDAPARLMIEARDVLVSAGGGESITVTGGDVAPE